MTPTSEPVAWDVAEQVAAAGGAAHRHPDRLGHPAGVSSPTSRRSPPRPRRSSRSRPGLRSLVGPARAQVATREEWIHANISSFRRLLGPVLERAGEERPRPPRRCSGRWAGSLPAPRWASCSGGCPGGCSASTTCFSQRATLRRTPCTSSGRTSSRSSGGTGFDPREFRLWIALHELTHRAQFTGVPWMRAHFLELVERSVAIASPDPRQVMDALGRMAVDIRYGRNPLAESGLVGALASPEQLETLRSIQGMMSLLEGHGDVTMDRAAARADPERGTLLAGAPSRRESASGLTRFFQQLIGLEAKLRQYADGERFVQAVERDRWSGAARPGLGGPREPAHGGRRSRRLTCWASRVRGLALEPGVTATVPDEAAQGGGTADRAVLVPRPRTSLCPARCPAGPTLLPCWCWRSPPDCEVVAHHVDHGLRAGSGARRGGRWTEVAVGSRCPRSSCTASTSPRARTSRRGRGRPGSGPATGCRHRSHSR